MSFNFSLRIWNESPDSGGTWTDISDYVDIAQSVFPVQEQTDRGEPVISTFNLKIIDTIPVALPVGVDVHLLREGNVFKKYVITKSEHDVETSFFNVSLSFAYYKLTEKKISTAVLQAQLISSNKYTDYTPSDNTGHENATYLWVLKCMFAVCGFDLTSDNDPEIWDRLMFSLNLDTGEAFGGTTQIKFSQIAFDVQMLYALNQTNAAYKMGEMVSKDINDLRPSLWDFIRVTFPIFGLTLVDDYTNDNGYKLKFYTDLEYVMPEWGQGSSNYFGYDYIYGYKVAEQQAQGVGVSVSFMVTNRTAYYHATVPLDVKREYVESQSEKLIPLEWFNSLRFLFRMPFPKYTYGQVYFKTDESDIVWYDLYNYAVHGRPCVSTIIKPYIRESFNGRNINTDSAKVVLLEYDLNGDKMNVEQIREVA